MQDREALERLWKKRRKSFHFKSGIDVHVGWDYNAYKWYADAYIISQYSGRLGYSPGRLWSGRVLGSRRELIGKLRLALAKRMNPGLAKVHAKLDPKNEYDTAYERYKHIFSKG